MTDSFDAAPSLTPVGIDKLELQLSVKENDEGTMSYNAHYNFTPVTADGTRIRADHRKGNLIPHLSAPQKADLKAIMDALHAKAKGVVT